MINFFKKKSKVDQKPEENYKVITENNVYADRLISRLEEENMKLREEIKLKEEEIEELLDQMTSLENRLKVMNRDMNTNASENLPNIISSPGEARIALENASKDKVWMKDQLNERTRNLDEK